MIEVIYTGLFVVVCGLMGLAPVYGNRRYSSFCFSIIGVCFLFRLLALYYYQFGTYEEELIFWVQISAVSHVVFVSVLLFFAKTYEDADCFTVFSAIGYFIVPSSFLFLIPALDMVDVVSIQPIIVQFKAVYYFYLALVLIYLGMSFHFLIQQRSYLAGYNRVKITYFTIAMLVFISGPVLTSAILLLFSNFSWLVYGPITIVPFWVILMLPLVRYNPQKARMVAKTMVKTCLLVLSIFGFVFLSFVMVNQFNSQVRAQIRDFMYIIISVGVFLFYSRMARFLDRFTDILFFRHQYDYKKIVTHFQERLDNVRSLESAINMVVCVLPVLLRTKKIQLYLLPDILKHQPSIVDKDDGVLYLSEDMPLYRFFDHGDAILVKEELDMMVYFESNIEQKKVYDALSLELTKKEIVVCCPLYIRGDLVGVFAVGERTMEAAFTDDDLVLLQSLSCHIIAIVQRVLQYDLLMAHKTDMTKLNDFCLQVNSTLEQRLIFEQYHLMMGTITKSCVSVVCLKSPAETMYNAFCRFGYDPQDVLVDLDLECGLLDQIWKDDMALYRFFSDGDGSDIFTTYYNQLLMRRALVIPLKDTQSVYGFLITFFDSDSFIEDHHDYFLKTLSQIMPQVVNNARIYEEVSLLNAYNQEVLDGMAAGIILCDPAKVIVAFNKKAGQVLELDPVDVIHSPCSVLFSVNSAFDILAHTFDTQTNHVKEMSIVTQDKQYVYSLSTGIVSYKGQDCVIAIITDITSIRILESQMARTNRLSSLGTMAASIAHEIRNPLVAVKTFSSLLPKKWQDPVFRGRFLEIVSPQIDRIQLLSRSLLSLGAPNTAQKTIVDINALLKEVRMLLLAKASEVSADIRISKIEDGRFLADRNQMIQVLINLVLNSLDAVKDTPGGVIVLSAKRKKGALVVEISDTGYGMDDYTKAHIFDPFFTTMDDGTGLGLSIVHKLMGQHQGHIDIQSIENNGTTFTLMFPDQDRLLEKMDGQSDKINVYQETNA